LDIIEAPAIKGVMAHLGYPPYFAMVLGFWKVLAAAAVAFPGLPRLKEWAYAGVFFELSGAAASHIAAHDHFANLIAPLGLLLVAMVSWGTRPENRTLGVLWHRSGSGGAKTAPPKSPPSWHAPQPDLRGVG
jgi:uncharacterized membrane protein YphA (DoxX/SURF4 family)